MPHFFEYFDVIWIVVVGKINDPVNRAPVESGVLPQPEETFVPLKDPSRPNMPLVVLKLSIRQLLLWGSLSIQMGVGHTAVGKKSGHQLSLSLQTRLIWGITMKWNCTKQQFSIQNLVGLVTFESSTRIQWKFGTSRKVLHSLVSSAICTGL